MLQEKEELLDKVHKISNERNAATKSLSSLSLEKEGIMSDLDEYIKKNSCFKNKISALEVENREQNLTIEKLKTHIALLESQNSRSRLNLSKDPSQKEATFTRMQKSVVLDKRALELDSAMLLKTEGGDCD